MDNSTEIYNNTSEYNSATDFSIPSNGTTPTHGSDLNYILAPLFSLVVIIILTVIVIMLLRRKRRIDRLRHQLMPFYNFAPGEEEDWETELLESDVEAHSRRV